MGKSRMLAMGKSRTGPAEPHLPLGHGLRGAASAGASRRGATKRPGPAEPHLPLGHGLRGAASAGASRRGATKLLPRQSRAGAVGVVARRLATVLSACPSS